MADESEFIFNKVNEFSIKVKKLPMKVNKSASIEIYFKKTLLKPQRLEDTKNLL